MPGATGEREIRARGNAFHARYFEGPDYMSRVNPVFRAGSIYRENIYPGIKPSQYRDPI